MYSANRYLLCLQQLKGILPKYTVKIAHVATHLLSANRYQMLSQNLRQLVGDKPVVEVVSTSCNKSANDKLQQA